MKTSVRLLCMLLALVMVISLVGCGSDKNKKKTTTTASTTTTTASATETTAAGDTTTVAEETTTAVANSDNTQAPSVDTTTAATTAGKTTSLTLDQVLAKMPASLKGKTFNVFYWESPYCNSEGKFSEDFTKKTGIKVNFVLGTYGNFATELVSKVSTGNSPDMARMLHNSPSRVQALQSLNNCNFSFNDTFWDQQTIKDFTYNNIPYCVGIANRNEAIGVLYNTKYVGDFCASKKLEDPYTLWEKGQWTWDNFEKISKAWKAQGDDYCGSSFCPLNIIPMCYGVDTVARDNTGHYKNTCNNAKLITAWKKTLEYKEAGIVNKDVWKMNEFMAGKVAFFFAGCVGSSFNISGKDDYGYKAFKLKKQLGLVPVPTDKYSIYTPLAEYYAFGVPKGAKNPEIMPYYLRYVKGQDESANFLNDKVKKAYTAIQKSAATKRFDTNAEVVTADSGIDGGAINFNIMNGDKTSAVNKILSQYSGNVQDGVDKANKQIDKFTAD